jgi:hypothetical protein
MEMGARAISIRLAHVPAALWIRRHDSLFGLPGHEIKGSACTDQERFVPQQSWLTAVSDLGAGGSSGEQPCERAAARLARRGPKDESPNRVGQCRAEPVAWLRAVAGDSPRVLGQELVPLQAEASLRSIEDVDSATAEGLAFAVLEVVDILRLADRQVGAAVAVEVRHTEREPELFVPSSRIAG